MIFNYKSWSGLKILLGISTVFNLFLIVVLFTGMQTQIMAQNERDFTQKKNDELTRVYNSTKTLEKCIQETKTYKTDVPEFKGEQVAKMSDLTICFINWK